MIITLEQAGHRLDAIIKEMRPELGLRQIRRLIDKGSILLNGLSSRPGMRPRPGQTLEFAPAIAPELASGPKLLAIQNDFCFFYKPAGWHTAQITGGDPRNLESIAPILLDQAAVTARPRLLQRLDYWTSGIILAALNDSAVSRYQRLASSCQKYYLALLHGSLCKEVTVANALDTAKRKKTAILKSPGMALNHTAFWPLAKLAGTELGFFPGICPEGSFTLALCRIQKGQRHQIRAHASVIGHPLAGDSLYGGTASVDSGHFYLEHFYLEFSGHALRHLEKDVSLARFWTGRPGFCTWFDMAGKRLGQPPVRPTGK